MRSAPAPRYVTPRGAMMRSTMMLAFARFLRCACGLKRAARAAPAQRADGEPA